MFDRALWRSQLQSALSRRRRDDLLNDGPYTLATQRRDDANLARIVERRKQGRRDQ